MEQTPVEWLIEQVEKQGDASENVSIGRIQMSIKVEDYLELQKQAKQIEKKQKISLLDWIRHNVNEVVGGWQLDGIFYTDEEIVDMYQNF